MKKCITGATETTRTERYWVTCKCQTVSWNFTSAFC